jgi:uncharacterized membrane protein YbhN (UPF0104 family)
MKRVVSLIIRYFVSVAIVITIATKVDFSAVIRILTTLPLLNSMVCAVLILLQQWICALRFSLVVRRTGRTIEIGKAMWLILESSFFSQAFVSFLGGDVFRVWRMRSAGISVPEAATAVTLDRLSGFGGNHLLLLASLPWILPRVTDSSVQLGSVVVGTVGLVAVAAAILLGYVRGRFALFQRLRSLSEARPLAQLILDIATAGRLLVDDYKTTIAISSLGLASALINPAVFFLLLTGVWVPSKISLACAVAVPLVIEIAVLPIAVAGWGLREGATAVIFGALGADPNIAVAASVGFGLLGIAIGLVGGCSWLADRLRSGRQPTDIHRGD